MLSWKINLFVAVTVVGIGAYPAWARAADAPASPAGHSHDGHHLCEADIEMPKDFASAVARIKGCRVKIGKQAAAQNWTEVHRPLDEATIILNKLMVLARDSGVPRSKWHETNLAAKELKKRLAEIHSTLDRVGSIDLAAVAKPIDAAIRRLELVSAGTTAAVQNPAVQAR